MLSRRKRNLELLDERSHILVAYYCALPLLYAKSGVRNNNLHILLNLNLATKSPVVENLFSGKETNLCWKDGTATLYNTALALSAGALSTAGRGKEYLLVCQGVEQR